MNLTRLSVLVLFILVIISCNFVSASDLSFDDNYSKSELDVVEIDSDNIPIKQIDEVVLEDSPNSHSSSSDDFTVYVGANSTQNGNGTKEDPFATLELACNNYNCGEQKDKVNVIINDGTYYLGDYLKFNTNNLNIIGNGSVIIKNLYNDKQQSFGSNCNFSMSNIIFNASNFDYILDWDDPKNAWFTPFIGDNGNIIFDNCTFADYHEIEENGIYNYILPAGADFNTGEYLYLFKNDNIVFNSCQFISSYGMSVGYIYIIHVI